MPSKTNQQPSTRPCRTFNIKSANRRKALQKSMEPHLNGACQLVSGEGVVGGHLAALRSHGGRPALVGGQDVRHQQLLQGVGACSQDAEPESDLRGTRRLLTTCMPVRGATGTDLAWLHSHHMAAAPRDVCTTTSAGYCRSFEKSDNAPLYRVTD